MFCSWRNATSSIRDLPSAIAVFEQEKTTPNLNPDFQGKIDVKLLALYLDTGDLDKTVPLVEAIDRSIVHIPDVTEFNAQAVRLGDTFLASKNVPGALNCYRRVRNNDQVIALEKAAIANLQQQMADNLKLIQADPLHSSSLQMLNDNCNVQIAKDQKILVQYQTLPPILPSLFLRIGSAYYSGGDYWEAAIVYRELMLRMPQCPEVESALYGSILAFDRAKQTERTLGLCQQYLAKYPQGKYANEVGFRRGILAYDAEEFDQAIAYFQDALKKQPDSPRHEQMEVILGDIMLRQQRFDESIAAYKHYLTDYPKGIFVEQAQYRIGLDLLFGGKAGTADEAIRTYIKLFPSGKYIPDAKYRLGRHQIRGQGISRGHHRLPGLAAGLW